MDLNNPLVAWGIKLLIGALGSNGLAAAIKQFNLGPIINTIVGLIGGAAGGTVVEQVMGGAAGSGVLGDVAGAGAGGASLMAIVGMISQMMNKK
jgi:hypothetical protein